MLFLMPLHIRKKTVRMGIALQITGAEMMIRSWKVFGKSFIKEFL